jgi:hypothetical protein
MQKFNIKPESTHSNRFVVLPFSTYLFAVGVEGF